MELEREFFLDVDGVLADFARGYRSWYNLNFKYEEAVDFGFCFRQFEQETGKGKNAFWRGMTTEFWASLIKTPECDMILALVEPYKPTLLTAPPLDDTGEAVAGKIQWIRKHLPNYFFDGRYFVGPNKEVIGKIPGAILIDDHADNCRAWANAGGSFVLVPRPWNYLSGYPVVESVQEQLIKILGEDY